MLPEYIKKTEFYFLQVIFAAGVYAGIYADQTYQVKNFYISVK